MANRILGMLKLFLHQLSLTVKHIKEQLQGSALQNILANDKTESHIDVVANVIVNSGVEVCAFIDGLDEYNDDLWDLCSQLDGLRDRTGMKMCLASRPERAFEDSFAGCSSIRMQDHNHNSIEAYMNRKMVKFLSQHPFIDGLFSPELLAAVVEKAQGVILWARLVIDEMIKSCDDNTTTRELLAFLETLPAELELLYERILAKINEKYQSEAALVLLMLTENEGTMKAATLFQAWEFLAVSALSRERSRSSHSFPVHEARVKALLGNLVDFVRPNQGPLRIRLVHRSLSPYLAWTNWIPVRMPEPLLQAYPDHFTKRLVVACIHQAGREANLDTTTLDYRLTKWTDGEDYVGWQSHFNQHMITSPQWLQWADFLLYSVDQFFEVDESPSDRRGKLTEFCWPADTSDLALLHVVRCKKCAHFVKSLGHWNGKPISRLYRAGLSDVLLLIVHQRDDLVVFRMEERYASLSVDMIEDLLDICLHQAMHGKHEQQDDLRLLKWFFNHKHFAGSRVACQYVSLSPSVSSRSSFHASNQWFSPQARFLALLRRASHLVPSGQETTLHHQDCVYKHAGRHVIYDWLHNDSRSSLLSEQQLLIFTALGVDLNVSYGEERVTPFHALLQIADTNEFRRDYQHFRNKFSALASAGLRPDHEGSGNDLCQYAESLLMRRRDSKLLTRLPNKRREYDIAHEAFFTDVIDAIRYYRKYDGHWPQVRDDSCPVQAYRLGKPVRWFDYTYLPVV